MLGKQLLTCIVLIPWPQTLIRQKSVKLIANVNLSQQSVNQSKMIIRIKMKNKGVITSNWYRALARKLKLLTFSQNWEIRLVFTKGRHHGWRKKFFFVATSRTLEIAILWKKYFRAWHSTTHKLPLINVFVLK